MVLPCHLAGPLPVGAVQEGRVGVAAAAGLAAADVPLYEGAGQGEAATTATGLSVRAEPGTGTYPPALKISDEQMAALPLRRHHWHGDWNYTLHPAPPAPLPAPPPPPGRGERPEWGRTRP